MQLLLVGECPSSKCEPRFRPANLSRLLTLGLTKAAVICDTRKHCATGEVASSRFRKTADHANKAGSGTKSETFPAREMTVNRGRDWSRYACDSRAASHRFFHRGSRLTCDLAQKRSATVSPAESDTELQSRARQNDFGRNAFLSDAFGFALPKATILASMVERAHGSPTDDARFVP